jgi:response regulator RpfG family c-di-GMP phosphodiesterase
VAGNGPIILIDDDWEDEELIREVLHELKIENKLIYFDNCIKAFAYLKSTTDNPLIIISDINLPKQTGIEFKKQIDEDPQLRSKSIPFVFLSTSKEKQYVDAAYKEMTVQGYFHKPSSFSELKRVIQLMVNYWQTARHPNT